MMAQALGLHLLPLHIPVMSANLELKIRHWILSKEIIPVLNFLLGSFSFFFEAELFGCIILRRDFSCCNSLLPLYIKIKSLQ